MKPAFHRFGSAVLFLAPLLAFGVWACVIFRLYLSQQLSNLQSPRFHLFTLGACGFLLLLSLAASLLFVPARPMPALTPGRFVKKLLSAVWLFLPAAAYLALPPVLSTPSALLDRMWSNVSSRSSQSSPGGRIDPAVVRTFILNSDPHAPLELTPLDLLVVRDDAELQQIVSRREVSMLGQWIALPDNPPNEFRLVRLTMVCCAADARPVGIIIQGQAEGAQPGAWFRAIGALVFDDPRETVIMKADTVTAMEPPEEIFLY